MAQIPIPERYQKVSSIAHDLGVRCRAEFDETKNYRRNNIEDRWLQDLRQFKGIYDPEIKARMTDKGCKAFVRLTRTKVKTMDARMLDLLFPSNGEKNWGIKPTPEPDMNQAEVQQIQMSIAQETGQQPNPEQIKDIVQKEAKKRCEKMASEMDDQLTESRYRSMICDVVHSGNLYGTGILKGPLVEERPTEKWLNAGEAGWQYQEELKFKPYVETPSVWDCYPDHMASSIQQARFIYQRYMMKPSEVLDLAERPMFDSESIIQYLREYPEGDYELQYYETELMNMSDQSSLPNTKDRKYEVLERWGTFLGKDLVEVGIDISDDQMHMEFEANIWVLGPIVIKAVLAPIKGVRWPYYFYYFDKDESSIWGEGIASIMRDPQFLFNSSVRATFDNAALSVGNIFEVLYDLLHENSQADPYSIYANKVYLRKLGDHPELAQFPVVRSYPIPSHTPELLQLAEFSRNVADETTTIPRYLQGNDQGVGGAGETASGLSMLMSAVNITLKDQIKAYDDDVTKPFITSLYHWNMQFNEREDIKGDYNVSANGLTNLMAKEVLMKQLNEFAQMTNNQADAIYINRGELLREFAKQTSFSNDNIVRTDKEVEQEQMKMMLMQEQAKLQAAMMEAEKQGINPQLVIAGALDQAAQRMAGAQQQQQGPPQEAGGY